jgi:uncharacterized membrane protein YeaQ/YmgE (transglycosylase-associated protein family)
MTMEATVAGNFARKSEDHRSSASTRVGGQYVIHCVVRFGLVAGFIASKIVNKSGEGMILDIILGIVGAVLGRAFSTQLLSLGEVPKHAPIGAPALDLGSRGPL